MNKIVFGVTIILAYLFICVFHFSPLTSYADNNVTKRLNAYGWDAFNDNNYKEAIFFFERALAISPQDPEAIYGISWTYFKLNRLKNAEKGFEKLFTKGYRKSSVAEALFFISLRLNKKKQARYYLSFLSSSKRKKYINYLKTSRNKKKQRKHYITKNKIRISKLNKYFNSLNKKHWHKAISIYNTLSLREKNRLDVKSSLAWAYFNIGSFQKAKKIFKKLNKLYPKNLEYRYALTLCAFKAKDEKLLFNLANTYSNDRRIRKYVCDYIKSKINDLYKKQKYQQATNYYQFFKKNTCKDYNDQIKELVAWSYYNQKKYPEALQYFTDLYHNNVTRPSVNQGLMSVLLALNHKSQAWILADRLSQSSLDKNREIAADFYYAQNLPSIAAYIYDGSSKIYKNVHSSYATTRYFYGHIRGDSGTSRLDFQFMPLIETKFTLGKQDKLALSLSSLLLQSGSLGEKPWLGTPNSNYSKGMALSSRSTLLPQIFLQHQDKITFSGTFGLTPIGGPISSLPVFNLSVHDSFYKKYISIFQKSITRSMLSWIGQKDPYTGKKWGRVLSSGLKTSTTFDIDDYWINLQLEYGHLWGRNIKNNNNISAGITVGKSISTTYFSDISFGIYTSLMHFENNSNFYTFGHGGYFSPQFFLATGPFVHLTSKIGLKWLLEVDGALSYLNFYEEKTALYPLEKKCPIEYYPGQHSSKIGYSAKISTGYLITPNVLLSLNGGINQSADYSQWHIGMGFKFYFKNRKGLLELDLPSLPASIQQ